MTVQYLPGGGGGVGKLKGGIGENDNKREGGLDVKFNTYGGGITFSFLFANWKSSGRVMGAKGANNRHLAGVR